MGWNFFLPHYETMDIPITSSGLVFTEDDRINLYYLNELYGNLAEDCFAKYARYFRVGYSHHLWRVGRHLPDRRQVWEIAKKNLAALLPRQPTAK